MKLILFILSMSLSLPAFSASQPTETRLMHFTRVGDGFRLEQCRVHSNAGLQGCSDRLLDRDQFGNLVSAIANSAANKKGMAIIGASLIGPMVLPFTAYAMNATLAPIKKISPRFAATASLVTGTVAMAAYLYWLGYKPYQEAQATQQSAEQTAVKLKEFAMNSQEGDVQDVVWSSTRLL